jgi:hypothetical protein
MSLHKHWRAAYNPILSLSGLLFLADSDSLLQDGLVHGSSIASWRDESGNAKHAVMATPAKKPTLDTAAALNGHPAVVFDGIDDALQTPTWGPFAQPTTHLVVCNLLSDVAVLSIIHDGRVALERQILSKYRPGINGGKYALQTSLATVINYTALGAIQVTTLLNGGASSCRIAKVERTPGNVGTFSSSGLTLGAEYNLVGNPASVRYYFHATVNRALTTPERDAAEAYLSARYGL